MRAVKDDMSQIKCAADYQLKTIYFYITDSCNLKCKHCWIDPAYTSAEHTASSLPLDLFRTILDQAKSLGLNGIKLSGGEPLLHPEIMDILGVVADEGLGLTIETNGTLITRETAGKIALCGKPFVSVSLDGADADTHEWVRGVKGCFDSTVQGIKNLVSEGLNTQLIMTVMRHNKGQMEAVIRLAESLGVGSVKFNLLQSVARGEKLYVAGHGLSFTEMVELGTWVETHLCEKTAVHLVYSHPMAFRPLSRMFDKGGNGCGTCSICNIIGVLANGSYALCGIAETVPEMVFGNAATDNLADVIRNTPILKEIRQGLPHKLEGVCNKCILKRMCRGYCLADNYVRSKKVWAPNWYCEEALKRGLFPESRLIR